MFLWEIIQNGKAHFFTVRRGEFLDGTAVKCRTEPFLRIQTNADLLFHCNTSIASYAVFPVFTTENACAKIISLRTKNPEIFRAENFSSVNLTGSNWDKPRRMDISYKDPENAENNIDIIVLANFSTSTSISTTANAPQTGIWYSYLTGEQVNIRRTNQILNLKPGELVILMSKKLDNVVSIDETLAENNTVIVLPTIAEDVVTVIAKETPSAIEVFDLSGNLVAKTYNSEDISIAGLNKGHYLVRVLIEDNISTHRIIKK